MTAFDTFQQLVKQFASAISILRDPLGETHEGLPRLVNLKTEYSKPDRKRGRTFDDRFLSDFEVSMAVSNEQEK